jgi:Lipase maturation factor
VINLQYRKPIDDRAAMIQVFVRLMGILWLFIFWDAGRQWDMLCGSEGLSPAVEFADTARSVYAQWAFFRFPSLLWISQSDFFAFGLMGLGAFGALLALSDRLATLGLTMCYTVWLSMVNFGGDFFSHQGDTFMLELGFLAVFASWMRNAGVGRKLALAALWLLNFRLWWSMGLTRLLYNPDFWPAQDFLADFLPNQAMPTGLAWSLAQGPTWLLQGLSIALLAVELLIPLLISWHRTRAIAAWAFFATSLFWILFANLGWLSYATLIASFPLLVGTRLGARIGERLLGFLRWNKYLRLDPQYRRLKDWPRKGGNAILQYQLFIQAVLIVLLFFRIGNQPLNFLNYTAYQSDVIAWEGERGFKTTLLLPLRAASNFRIANPYGDSQTGAVGHHALFFEASADTASGYWHPYSYRFLPGAGNPPQRVSPVFPRFEQQLHYEANVSSFHQRNPFFHLWGTKQCWTTTLISAMRAGRNPAAWFPSDPLHGAKPQGLRMVVRRLEFATPEEAAQSQSEWRYIPVASYDLTPEGAGLACPLLAGF